MMRWSNAVSAAGYSLQMVVLCIEEELWALDCVFGDRM